MPAIPEPTRDSITWRLILHAEQNWPQLDKVQVSCRAGFAYAAGVLPGGETIPLFRLRYGGSAHSLGFAIYTAGRYEDTVLLTDSPPELRKKPRHRLHRLPRQHRARTRKLSPNELTEPPT